MESAILEIIKSAPSVAAILVVVIMFLKHLTAQNKQFIEHLQSGSTILKNIEERNREIHIESNVVMKENIAMLGEVKEALHTLRDKPNGKAA